MRIVILTLMLILGGSFVQTQPHSIPSSPVIRPLDSTRISVEIYNPVAIPEPTDKAIDYYRSGNILWVVSLLWGLVIPLVFLLSGWSTNVRLWAQRVGKKWFLIIVLYAIVFIGAMFIFDLPLKFYTGYIRQHTYGVSTQSIGKWFTDYAVVTSLGIIVGILFLWIPYAIMRKSPKLWWLITGILTLPAFIFSMFISPIFIEPLFNNAGSMHDKDLETKIVSLADRAGIEGSRVYEVEKSVDTKKLNAYVTGFGNTKRIVLWDTMLKRLNDSEVLFVLAHEIGHYVLNHIWKMVLLLSSVVTIILFLIHRTVAILRKKYSIPELSDISSLPLLVLLFSMYGFLATPIVNAYSRHIERESDRFALELTKDNYDGARSFEKMQFDNLNVPRPGLLYTILRATHPSVAERIDFCNTYKPWETGQPLRYGEYFKPVGDTLQRKR
jgi:STE24 endopeptidase